MPRNNSQQRRDRRYYAAIERQKAAIEREPTWYAPVDHLLRPEHRPTDDRHDTAFERRRQVIVKYARLYRSGRPVPCTPSYEELNDPAKRKHPAHADGKIIYDSQHAAEAAAAELQLAGSHPMKPYVCSRGRRGHLHLTTISLGRKAVA